MIQLVNFLSIVMRLLPQIVKFAQNYTRRLLIAHHVHINYYHALLQILYRYFYKSLVRKHATSHLYVHYLLQ